MGGLEYNDELNMRLDGTYELFNKLLEVETNVLEGLASTYVDKHSLKKAFLSGTNFNSEHINIVWTTYF